MAGISPRKNKDGIITSYDITVSRGYDQYGKKMPPYRKAWKPDRGMTEKQIEKELERQAFLFEEEVKNGGGAVNGSIKMGVFCDMYIEASKTFLAPSTHAYYKKNIEDFIKPAFGHLKVRDIHPTHVQQYIQRLAELPKQSKGIEAAKGDTGGLLAPATIKRYVAILQAVLRFAVKQQIIGDSPADAKKLSLPKVVQPEIDFFSKSEAEKMLSCLAGEPLQFQVLIHLAIHTGARRAELVALKFSDINFDTNKVTIRRAAYRLTGQGTLFKPPKDGKIREISIDPVYTEMIRLLQEEKQQEAAKLGTQWHENGFLFTQWNGNVMDLGTPSHCFCDFLEKNDLPHKKFHSLRHSSATLSVQGGTNLRTVQNRLGHASIRTTNIYLHAVEEADVEAARTLGAMFNTGTKSKDSQPPLNIKSASGE